MAKYMEFIDIYAGLDRTEYRRYESEFAEESATMTGMIQRARDEGRVEGERAILERQLRRRFGFLPLRVVERLHQAPSDDIEAWADNMLDADALEKVFQPSSKSS